MKLTLTKMQPSVSKQIPLSTFSKILNYSFKKFAYFFITTLPCVE